MPTFAHLESRGSAQRSTLASSSSTDGLLGDVHGGGALFAAAADTLVVGAPAPAAGARGLVLLLRGIFFVVHYVAFEHNSAQLRTVFLQWTRLLEDAPQHAIDYELEARILRHLSVPSNSRLVVHAGIVATLEQHDDAVKHDLALARLLNLLEGGHCASGAVLEAVLEEVECAASQGARQLRLRQVNRLLLLAWRAVVSAPYTPPPLLRRLAAAVARFTALPQPIGGLALALTERLPREAACPGMHRRREQQAPLFVLTDTAHGAGFVSAASTLGLRDGATASAALQACLAHAFNDTVVVQRRRRTIVDAFWVGREQRE